MCGDVRFSRGNLLAEKRTRLDVSLGSIAPSSPASGAASPDGFGVPAREERFSDDSTGAPNPSGRRWLEPIGRKVRKKIVRIRAIDVNVEEFPDP